MAMSISSELSRRLAEIGFMAGGYGLTPQSRVIFEGLQAALPDSEYPLIGLALNHINTGKPGEAVKILQDQALKKHPDSALVHAFLALALRLAGHTQAAEREIQQVLERNDLDDPQATALAQSLRDPG